MLPVGPWNNMSRGRNTAMGNELEPRSPAWLSARSRLMPCNNFDQLKLWLVVCLTEAKLLSKEYHVRHPLIGGRAIVLDGPKHSLTLGRYRLDHEKVCLFAGSNQDKLLRRFSFELLTGDQVLYSRLSESTEYGAMALLSAHEVGVAIRTADTVVIDVAEEFEMPPLPAAWNSTSAAT